MIRNPDRRLFLRGGRPLPIRPPWSLPEDDFVKRCNRYEACCRQCPQGILETDLLGFPLVNFSNKSGVRATCADCHLARDLGPKLARKTVAVRELLNKSKDTIDTRENSWITV